MKLKIKHLAGYLPYGLKGIMYYGGCVRENVELGLMDIPVWLNGSYPIKPILRPLSDLTKDQVIKYGYPNKEMFNEDLKNQTICFKIVNELLEKHFDIYGLIENNLAIDINTL